MAAQDSSVYMAPPAEVVGNAFARQYYTILQQSPGLVYRFYQDISKLGRTGNNGVMASTTSMDAINVKIQSYGSLKADIKHVDAQDSSNGGVIVLVTGHMIMDDGSRRGFTQTFFLAPQDKGYFVLNDIFRYLDDDDVQHNEKLDDVIVPAVPSQEDASTVQDKHVQENHISEESNGEVFNSREIVEVAVEEEEVVEEEEPMAEVVDEGPEDSQVVIESSVKVEEAPDDSPGLRKSYASIVLKNSPGAAPSPSLPKSMPKVQGQKMHASPSPVSVVSPSSANLFNDNNSHEPEGDCHSIYLKNLPYNVSYSAVEEALKGFGTIKTGSIQIRHAKGFVFGFVDFEEPSAAQSAIEASPITIGGRDVVVEEKRSGSRGSGRRFFPGRGGGGGFRGEGGRGRGSFGGGRGYGRGENRSDYGSRGGRGHRHHSEGYRRNDQISNGAGHGNRGGGFGNGNMRTYRVPAQA